MTNTSSVGGPSYAQMPYQTQAPTQTYGVAPTQQGYQADGYQARQYQQAPMQAAAPKEEYQVINKTDVAFGIAGAVGGYFLAGMVGLTGPIGALIAGLVLLGLSAGIRGIKHMSDKKQQQQPMQAVHPGFQQQYNYQPQYQNSYNTSMAPQQQQQQYYAPQQPVPQMPNNMQYAQSYQQYQQPQQQKSLWDKFLSWL